MKRRAGSIVTVVVLLFSIIVALSTPAAADPGWYDTSWAYRRAITFSTATSTPNYQVLVTLTTGIMGSPYYANVNADGSDIRFTGSDGTTPQDYWIESWNNTNTSKIWVKVKSSGTSTIYMYYGNQSASPASDGDATFLFFDDFDNSSGTGLNGSKWTQHSTDGGYDSVSVSDGIATATLPDSGHDTERQSATISKQSFNIHNTPITIEARRKVAFSGESDYGYIAAVSSIHLSDNATEVSNLSAPRIDAWYAWSGYSENDWINLLAVDGGYLNCNDTGDCYDNFIINNTWIREKDVFKSGHTKHYRDGELKLQNTNTTSLSTCYLKLQSGINLTLAIGTQYIYFDFVAVHNYTYPEPETTVGSEEFRCTCGNICVNTSGWWRDCGTFNASGTPIQHATNNATTGDTICVKDGTYQENVSVNKQLTIHSENGSANCNVQAKIPSDHVFKVTVNYVNLTGFNVTGAAGNSKAGIYLASVDHCNISGNNASNNWNGICLHSSNHNNVTNNTANANTQYGIAIEESSNNVLKINLMSGNGYNFGIYGDSLSHYLHDIDTTNLVDGKPIYYWVGKHDQQVPENAAGFVGIINSTNITVKDQTLTKNREGVLLANTSHSIIDNISAPSNHYGILLRFSSGNNTLSNNRANSNSYYGIYLESSCCNNLTNNTANSNSGNDGIFLHKSDNTNLAGNTANSNEGSGIHLRSSSHNNVTNNNASGNKDHGICMDNSHHNNFSSNTANNNEQHGFCLFYSHHNVITNRSAGNIVNNNSKYGFFLLYAHDNEITCNWVAHNDACGFYLAGGSTGNNVSLNNIMSNGEPQGGGVYHWNFYNNQTDAVDAKNNYWVATDNETIDKSIYDDDPGEGGGKVTFYPPLEGASPCAPIPELATIVLFGVGLLALVGYVGWRRKKS